jgi:hypothetical protein
MSQVYAQAQAASQAAAVTTTNIVLPNLSIGNGGLNNLAKDLESVLPSTKTSAPRHSPKPKIKNVNEVGGNDNEIGEGAEGDSDLSDEEDDENDSNDETPG